MIRIDIDKTWLHQKYIDESLTCKRIGEIAGVCCSTIWNKLRYFEIPICKSGPRKGSKFSKEHKKRLAIAHKGIKNFWYGKHRSEETKEKMSKAKSGKRLNKEHMEKMHEAGINKWKRTNRNERLVRMKEMHEAGINRWRKMNKDERSAHMHLAVVASQKANPSFIEKAICKVLDEVGIKYKTQVPFNCGRFIADIFIPSKNLILECNGDYWHNYRIFPERLKRDESFEEYAKNKGCRLVWLWESEIRKNSKDLLRKENVIKESGSFGHNSEHQFLSV